MDIHIPELDEIEATSRKAPKLPATRIVMRTTFDLQRRDRD
jgi:hypothetical protein